MHQGNKERESWVILAAGIQKKGNLSGNAWVYDEAEVFRSNLKYLEMLKIRKPCKGLRMCKGV